MPGLSVVVICPPGEKDEGASCVRRVRAALQKADVDREIIVARSGPDGAPDADSQARAPDLKTIALAPDGTYGDAVRAGLGAATRELVLFLRADAGLRPSDIETALQAWMDTGADLVSAISAAGMDRRPRLVDRLVDRLWRRGFGACLLGIPAAGVGVGLELVRRSVLDRFRLTAETEPLVRVQLLASVRARGLSVHEVSLGRTTRTGVGPLGPLDVPSARSALDLGRCWWEVERGLLREEGRELRRWELVSIGIVLLVASFLRLYRIDEYMTFLADEGRDALIVRDIVLGKSFPLVGPGTSIGGMHLGPLYYYLMAPPLALSRLSPVGPAVMVAVLGVLTVALLWWFGRRILGRAPALAMTALYALSPTVITYSRSSWNPNIMPFFALLALYGTWRVWRRGSPRWLPAIAVALAFALNSHYLGLLLLPTIGVFLAFSGRVLRPRVVVAAVCLFLLLMAPTLVYELQNDWVDVRAATRFVFGQGRAAGLDVRAVPAVAWSMWSELSTSLLAGKNPVVGRWIALGLSGLVVAHALVRRRRDLWFVMSWLGFGLLGLSLGLPGQPIHDHYYGFLFPVPFLLAGFGLDLLDRGLAGRIASVLLLAPPLFTMVVPLRYRPGLVVQSGPLQYPPNRHLDRSRGIADVICAEAAGRSFNLLVLPGMKSDAIYRYFLTLRHAPLRPMEERITNELFVICDEPGCQPIDEPGLPIPGFGTALVRQQWTFSEGVRLLRLVRAPSGR